MSEPSGDIDVEYGEGDVNTIDPADDQYDDSDDDFDPGYAEGDVNVRGGGPAGGGAGAGGGMPEAVLAYLAESLSNEPAAVDIDSVRREGSVRLSLRVSPEDMGRVIGRRGRTAQAIRTLIGVAGVRDGVQTSVDIVDD